MTPEEKREYNKKYRAAGFGKNADARYRERWRERVLQRERERAKKRRDAR